jgi:hypothetical protein
MQLFCCKLIAITEIKRGICQKISYSKQLQVPTHLLRSYDQAIIHFGLFEAFQARCSWQCRKRYIFFFERRFNLQARSHQF